MPAPKAPGKTTGAKPARATPRKVSREQAKAAIDEIKHGKHATFRGLALNLPPALPASFALDALEIEASGGAQLADLRAVIVGVLGDEQWRMIRRKIAEDGDPIDNIEAILSDLLDVMLAPYGLDLGESSASVKP